MRLNDNDDSMDDMPNPKAYQMLQNELHDAITTAYRKVGYQLGIDDFTMLQGYVLVTEFTGLDGEKRLDLMASEDSRTWQIKGWLDHARVNIEAQQIASC